MWPDNFYRVGDSDGCETRTLFEGFLSYSVECFRERDGPECAASTEHIVPDSCHREAVVLIGDGVRDDGVGDSDHIAVDFGGVCRHVEYVLDGYCPDVL